MFDFLKIGEKLQALRSRMDSVKAELKSMRVEAEVGGGAVKAVASGDRRLLSLHLDEDLLAGESVQTRHDLIVGAVNAALVQAERQSRELIKERTSDIVPSLPGLDLSQWL